MREALPAALAAILLILTLPACVLPVRTAPGMTGRVVERGTGEPVAGAIVVVRFDGLAGDGIPDRETLGHAEARTGADGSFTIGRHFRAGLALWPVFQTEVRVVSVLSPSHRCPSPRRVTDTTGVVVALDPASNTAEQRDSCRAVGSRRGEAEEYRTAWSQLHSTPQTTHPKHGPLERTLAARSTLGFGANCAGPVTDLALAPGGHHLAYVSNSGEQPQVHLVELPPTGPTAPRLVLNTEDVPPRRLAWIDPGELALWLPPDASQTARTLPGTAPRRTETIWTEESAHPAAPDRYARTSTKTGLEAQPLEPEDLSDSGDTLWLGRSFGIERTLDAATALPRDRLLVRGEDGSRTAIALPGEACGGARFGQPQARIGSAGRLAFDLRFVEGGCHAVAIDLESGTWIRVDHEPNDTQCRFQRTLPPGQLATALRGWTRELNEAMQASGLDPRSAYALRIGENGTTRVFGRNSDGGILSADAPRFPLATPLRHIDVTTVAPVTPGNRRSKNSAPAMAPL